MDLRIGAVAKAVKDRRRLVLGLDPAVIQVPEATIRLAPGDTGEQRVLLCPPAGGNLRTATNNAASDGWVPRTSAAPNGRAVTHNNAATRVGGGI